MNQARETGAFMPNTEDIWNGRPKTACQAPVGHTGANIQSASSSDRPKNKPFPIDSKHCGGGQSPGLLTPASLQLAQIQAQLTLHRLKLAQTAVGGDTAAAAAVLNQVLCNVAMSQPLLNQLRTSTMVSAPHGHAGGAQLSLAFPAGTMAFPPQNPGLETLVGGGLGNRPGQSSNSAGLNPFRGRFPQAPSQNASLGRMAGTMFPLDTDRGSQYDTTGKSNNGQSVPPGIQANIGKQSGFQTDLYEAGRLDLQPGFTGEQNRNALKAGNPKEQQWQSLVTFSSSGKQDIMVPHSGGAWVTSGQSFYTRNTELYNPEEPTTDSKYNPVGRTALGRGTQGIVGYQQLQPGEASLGGAPTPLQPHQFNDFHGVTPSHLPHHCTICDMKVYNLTDWDHHVNGKLHLQNRLLYTESPISGSVDFPAFSGGSLSSSVNNSMSSVNQDISPGPNSVYLPSAPIRIQPLTGNGFTSSQTGSKVVKPRNPNATVSGQQSTEFPQRKFIFGRVVHICNLPEGSCTENDVINLGLPFGKVTNYILMRSTHQAFLEMAYMEAAQAMVKYYQLNPATINDEKLLIRMSKRYKELQLKKPGKDVESIIQDIHFQREREEIECYPQERPRSRSPIRRSLSPRSHSPSYTSCSSAHSPQGACRGEWSNGPALGPTGVPWDWSPQEHWEVRDEACWRNGDRHGDAAPDGWPQDRRRPRPSVPDRWSSRRAEERVEVQRGSREKYPRGSPHRLPSPYRSKEADWSPRQPHQHNEGKAKRREAEGRQRNWKSESEGRDVSPCAKTPEDRKQTSPVRGRSRKPSPRQEMEQKQSETGQEKPQKEKSLSPHRRGKDVDGAKSERDTNNKAEEDEGGYETEEESWYPQNMEELVTVDEVGEEDDYVVEPDLPELQEKPTVQDLAMEPPQTGDSSNGRKEGVQDDTALESVNVTLPLQEHAGDPSDLCPTPASSASDGPCSNQGEGPGQELNAVSEEPCPCTDVALAQPPPECLPDHRGECSPTSYVTNKPAPITKATGKDIQHQDEHTGDIPMTDTSSPSHQSPSSTDVDSPLWEDDSVVSEHSIPMGVEFVVPRSGYFCKLCGLFYASEETAKIAHCRSTVHYKNLQKYLSQLAADSLENLHTCPANPERSSLVPQTKEKSPAGVGLN